jgi:hypothetical protein
MMVTGCFGTILSRFKVVTADEVRIAEWIYWPLVCTTRNYILLITDTHRD